MWVTCMAGGVAQAPVHVVMGHGGAPLTFNVRPQPQPYWELVDLEHGYLRITANATTFHTQVGLDTHMAFPGFAIN
jgi:hypothetical protein